MVGDELMSRLRREALCSTKLSYVSVRSQKRPAPARQDSNLQHQH